MSETVAMSAAKCGAETRGGKACGLPAGHGTDHVGIGRCRRHGGSTPSHQRAAAVIVGQQQIVRLGLSLKVSPIDGLLEALYSAAGEAAWLQQKVASMATNDDGEDTSSEDLIGGPWVELWHRARVDQARFAKMALDAGVAERAVRIAESMGEQLGAALEGALADLEAAGVELSPERRMIVVRGFVSRAAQLERGGEIDGTASNA